MSTKPTENGSTPHPVTLNLDELTEPLGRFIYKAETYEYVNPSARGLLHARRQDRLTRRIAELEEATSDPSEEEEREYEEAVRLLVETVTTLPAERVRAAELIDLQTVVMGFFGWREFVSKHRLDALTRMIAPSLTPANLSRDLMRDGRKQLPRRGSKSRSRS